LVVPTPPDVGSGGSTDDVLDLEEGPELAAGVGGDDGVPTVVDPGGELGQVLEDVEVGGCEGLPVLRAGRPTLMERSVNAIRSAAFERGPWRSVAELWA
jgi:hypothetical protein